MNASFQHGYVGSIQIAAKGKLFLAQARFNKTMDMEGLSLSELAVRYEQLARKSGQLTAEIETCEAYLKAMLDFTYKNGAKYSMVTVEEIVQAVHAVECDRRQHLLHVRFEKSLLSSCLNGGEEADSRNPV
ncbi:hypothetical protein ACFSR7_05060 [Cohnella sp. GCM10020058]|uniref:hypothetical protein n=1 Tax=Cohnella sp. GCM10020058 TaxID=3317330 RepID=UPI0036349677